MVIAGLLALSAAMAPDFAAEARARGVEAPVIAFAATAELAGFARQVTAGARDPALALYEALLAEKGAGRIAGDPDNRPKARPPKTAAELWRAATSEGATLDRSAGCYELTVLYVAMARAVGLEAVGAEREAAEDTGQIGHVMAGVRRRKGGPLSLFDLQNETTRPRGAHRELGDLELAAHHYNHLSVAAYLRGDLDAARRAIDDALRLAPDNPAFLSNRATVLVAQGELHLALAEASFAVELAPRVPIHRYTLGRVQLESGDARAAFATLSAVVALRADYHLARRDLGWTALLLGRRELAERELTRVQGHGVPEAALYLALAQVARGDAAAARATLKKGLAETPTDESLYALRLILEKERAPPALGPEVTRLSRLLDSLPER